MIVNCIDPPSLLVPLIFTLHTLQPEFDINKRFITPNLKSIAWDYQPPHMHVLPLFLLVLLEAINIGTQPRYDIKFSVTLQDALLPKLDTIELDGYGLSELCVLALKIKLLHSEWKDLDPPTHFAQPVRMQVMAFEVEGAQVWQHLAPLVGSEDNGELNKDTTEIDPLRLYLDTLCGPESEFFSTPNLTLAHDLLEWALNDVANA
ncbi:hypothetical protein FRC00_007185 [Tulasnella sp. 408]|nr:hypothetical protein FRC00_007185 [Tulasnella sp. 408]